MPVRQLPVSPDVRHVKLEAKYLLRAFRAGDEPALADFRAYGSKDADAKNAKLSDAQLVLARSYGATSFPQLIAAVDFICSCWSKDGNRVRAAAIAHLEILKDYKQSPHRGWCDDLNAAAMQGVGAAMASMRDEMNSIADVPARQELMRAWMQTSQALNKFGLVRDPDRKTTPFVIEAKRVPVTAEYAHLRVAQKTDSEVLAEEEVRRSHVEELMKQHAQDPTRVNRNFERMRAHNAEFPRVSGAAVSPEFERQRRLMKECYQLYIASHPLP